MKKTKVKSYRCKRNFSGAELGGTSFYVPFNAKVCARVSGNPELDITKKTDPNETIIIQYKKRICVTKASRFIKYFAKVFE